MYYLEDGEKKMMSSREIFLNIMHFKKVFSPPLWDLEGISSGTIYRWWNQGLPLGVSPYDYFGFSKELMLPIDFGPIPSYPPKFLEENEDYIVYINRWGFIEKKSKVYTPERAGYQAYCYIDTPNKSREDWNNYKKRYNPRDLRRFPKYWGEEFFEWCNNLDMPIKLRIDWGPGRGPKGGYTFGFERFLQFIWREPDLIHDVMNSYADFTINILKEISKVRVDYVVFVEDGIAYRHGPIISPKTYEQFWYPYLKKVIDFLRTLNIDIICYYASGNINQLMPILLKAGFNTFAPLESAAGMDAIKLREKYGKNIRLMGNISKQALVNGPKAIEKEIYQKVPLLMEEGGYLPAVDDTILPEISFENFKYYVNCLRSVNVKK